MAPRYPVLGNRPIDQWKVTELKEELKRRKITIKGLKEDLIKRLDEAIRIERANDEKANGLGSDSESEDLVRDAEAVPDVADVKKEIINQGGDENKSENNIPIPTEINHGITLSDPLGSEAGVALYVNDSSIIEEKLVSHASDDETSVVVPETVVSQAALSDHDGQNIETEDEDRNLQPQLKAPQVENEDLKHDLETNALKSSKEDLIMPNPFSPKNQVLEISPATGSVITSVSITTDTVTINETIELKDNISAENVKLELDVKLEMVEPSSITVVAADGKSHPMDIEEPLENTAFVGEKDDSSGTDADEISKNIEVVDVGYSEKLNLDRSSGDDSMEEDALDSKQVESKCNPEAEDTRERSGVTIIKHEFHESIIKKESYSEFLGDKKDPNVEKNDHSALLAEKRKLPDHAVVGNEPGKRQRRWNTENIKLPEQKGSNLTPSATPKDTSLSTDGKQFSRSDSTVSEGAAKERVVPPSLISPSNSLRIVNFLRPFTLKAVQELLGKTGTVTSFWMDHIKTHCYVTFSSVEEAVETRNAVYNLQWPPNGGRLLAAEFVDPQEVKKRVEAPQPPTPSNTSAPVVPSPVPALHPQPSPRQPRQQLPSPPSLPPPPPPLTNPPQAKERFPLPPPPPIVDKIETPIVTLDDLFRKTKATPRIYYLPLSDEQVAAKLAEEGKMTKT